MGAKVLTVTLWDNTAKIKNAATLVTLKTRKNPNHCTPVLYKSFVLGAIIRVINK